MRPLLVFSAVFLSAILFGALLAYPVHEILSAYADIPLNKTVSRTTLISGLLFSLLYFSYYSRLSLNGLGIRSGHAHIRLLQGLAAGLAIIAIIETTLVMLGIHDLDKQRFLSLEHLSLVIFKGLATGLLVAIIEELMFRGALLGGLSRQTNAAVALVTVSLVYSAVHFLKFRALPVDTGITWYTGVAMIPPALFQFAEPVRYDTMLTLFFLGLLLGLVRLMTGNLILCIGIHAGLITGEKLIQYLADFAPHSPHAHLVNRYDQFLGDLASVWLVIFCVMVYFCFRRRAGPARR